MLPNLFRTEEDWAGVGREAGHIVKAAADAVALLRRTCLGLPRLRHHVLLQPYTGEVHACLDKRASDADALAWEEGLRGAGFDKVSGSPIDVPPDSFGREPWVWVKMAADPVIAFLAKALNYQPSDVNRVIGGPSPLAATLASGAFGAGLGYLGGTAAEQFLPDREFRRGTLRRNAALVGAAAGAAPAVLWGVTSHQHHPDRPGLRAWLSSWPFRPQDDAAGPVKRALDSLREVAGVDPADHLEKCAFTLTDQPLGTGLDLAAQLPMIPRDEFGRVVLGDPNTPHPIRAATVGLVDAASSASGGNPFVSPYDVARVSLGGAARGLVVGKTLGALAGLRPESQKELQRAGVWGAMLTAVVPNALPHIPHLFPNWGR